MRKMRFMVVALLAVLGITAVAYAQTNSYTVTAKVPAGGTKKKPKIEGFTFGYTVSDPAGNIPQVVKTYSIGISGSQVNTSVTKTCTAASINGYNNGDNSKCAAKAKIGTGTVTAIVGSAGQPVAQKAGDCKLQLTIYNGGNNHAALFLEGGTGNAAFPCPAGIHQAIDAKWVKKDGGTALVFDVPDNLRHPVPGLDVAVVDVTSKLPGAKGKKGGKTRGYFESVGCGGQHRFATVTFTDENGVATPVKQDIGKC